MNAHLAVQGILAADSGYISAAGSGARVFYDEVDQKTQLPFSIVMLDDSNPNDTKDGVSTLDFDMVYVTHFGETMKTTAALASAARTALDRKSGTYNTVVVESIQYQSQRTGSEQLVDKKTHTIEQLYQVMTKQ